MITAKQLKNIVSATRATEFRRGYYCAVANIIRTHGEDVIARDVLQNFGAVDFGDIDPQDYEVLKSIAAEIKRRK